MPAMSRKILHLDLDAFFCAVEELRDPSLAGKPFAVGGRPEERGVVASCSYSARKYGIHSAMPMARAVRLFPGLLIVSSKHGVYSQYSEMVMRYVRDLSSLYEQISIDEAFSDVSENPEDPGIIAKNLQSTIQKETGLPCSLGVASNKLVAKIANDVGKAARRGNGPPNAITIVPPGQEAEFLAPLPTGALWGVGPKTASRLAEIGILTIGDLADWSEVDLVRRFGKYGYDLSKHAKGIDDSPIITFHETKSISQETTFSKDVSDEKYLKKVISEQAGQVGKRLRKANLAGTTVKIKIRWPDFTTLTRQQSFEISITGDEQIYQAAENLLMKVWQTGQPVRLIGVGVSGLGPPIRQLSFWEQILDNPDHKVSDREQRLEQVIDELRQRFGREILVRGSKK
jgi:DNA polymerase-4